MPLFSGKHLERSFFLVVSLLNLIPLLSYHFFPGYDSPAHLYNARLIRSLVFNESELASSFYSFTKEALPNWTGHLFLSFFGFFFQAFIAEKLLCAVYLVGLPFSFRYLVRNISPQNTLISYLIFPFTYAYVFYMGFYNFSLALVFLFLSLGLWYKNQSGPYTFALFIKLFFLILLAYFSHLFVFTLLLGTLGFQVGLKFISDLFQSEKTTKEILILFLRKAWFLLLLTFIPLIFTFLYFYSRSGGGSEPSKNNFGELLTTLTDIRSIVAFQYGNESSVTTKIFYILGIFFIISLCMRIVRIIRDRQIFFNTRGVISMLFSSSNVWLYMAILMLYAYFIMPEVIASASYTKVRFEMFFYFFFILWIASGDNIKWISFLLVLALLYYTYELKVKQKEETSYLAGVAKDCNSISYFIPDNSVVLPVSAKGGHWFLRHFSNYLGVDKPFIILENYECEIDYFPLKWNIEKMPNNTLGTFDARDNICLKWRTNKANAEHKIDYVLLFGKIDQLSDSCEQGIKSAISKNYKLVYFNRSYSLYALK